MFKMVDRESGRLLALRADVTPQIARIVATRMRDEPKPLRLAYVTNVFRYDEPQVGRYREFYQAGVELIGLPNPEGDAEMIAMTVEGLRAARARALPDRRGAGRVLPRHPRGPRPPTPPPRASCASALGRKDVSALERLVGELAAPAAVTELLLALPALYGRGDVLDRAERARQEPALGGARSPTWPRSTGCSRAYGLADSVLLDLGEVRGFDYYSGVHFEAYVSGLGRPAGGRRPLRPDAGPLRLRLPGHRLRLRGGAGAAGDGVAGRGAARCPGRTSSSSTSRRTRPGRSRSPGACATLGAAVARDIISRPLERVARLRAAAARRAGRCHRRPRGPTPDAGAGAGSRGRRGAASGAHAGGASCSPTRGRHFPGLGGAVMPNIVIVGAQWGDEGKGKVVDVLAPHVDVVVALPGRQQCRPHRRGGRARSSCSSPSPRASCTRAAAA